MTAIERNLTAQQLEKIQALVGTISEDDLKYVDTYISDYLGIFIPSVGFCQYAIRVGHTHPSYSFVVFFTAEQQFLKTTIALSDDQYLGACLSPGLPHEEEETDQFTRYAALFIDRNYFELRCRHYLAAAPTPVYFWQQFAVSPETMTDIKRFIDAGDRPTRYSLPYRNALAELITQGLLQWLFPGDSGASLLSPKMDVVAIIDYMEDHFGDKLTVPLLARKMRLSASQFNRRFKQETGSSPMDFFLELRLKKARKLLRSSTKTITEIAQDCGFASASHFSTAFKKHTSLSPSDYQQLYQRAT
ncbi:helix-turn-helix domain-containing protein [Acetobacterium wieringae]|uniref:Helix-turn-helix domain-containing protein n=1 Tax=Acetobacterium wieringae TaxID=52694 RepID=A0A5D0WWV2_9FIRM|nr:helix-turn-helix domain-containing protein [Acetobacterium wieringae]TYC88466.1 helix-turn-helix domain-containing protein [Acetobacterium wieringae]